MSWRKRKAKTIAFRTKSRGTRCGFALPILTIRLANGLLHAGNGSAGGSGDDGSLPNIERLSRTVKEGEEWGNSILDVESAKLKVETGKRRTTRLSSRYRSRLHSSFSPPNQVFVWLSFCASCPFSSPSKTKMSDLIGAVSRWFLSDEDQVTDESEDSNHQDEDEDNGAPERTTLKEERSHNHHPENNVLQDCQDPSSETQPLLTTSRAASSSDLVADCDQDDQNNLDSGSESDSLINKTDCHDKEDVTESAAYKEEKAGAEVGDADDACCSEGYLKQQAEEVQRSLNELRISNFSGQSSSMDTGFLVPLSRFFWAVVAAFLLRYYLWNKEEHEEEE